MAPLKPMKWDSPQLMAAFNAFMGYGAITNDENIAAKVAAHVGNGCTVVAVTNLLRNRKAFFKPNPAAADAVVAVTGDTEDIPKVASKRKAKTAEDKPSKAQKLSKAKKKKIMSDDEGEGHEKKTATGLNTPPLSNIKRQSRRALATVDYSTLDGNDDDTPDGKVKKEESNDGKGDDGDFSLLS